MNVEKRTVNLGCQLNSLEGSIKNAIQDLLKIKEKYPEYKNLRLDVDYEYDGNSLNLRLFVDFCDSGSLEATIAE